MDKDISVAEKTQTLFWEQGITIASILMVIAMTIGVFVKALLPGGTAGGAVDVEFTRKIRCEGGRSIAWYLWSNSQSNSQ